MSKKDKNIPARHGEIVICTTAGKEARLDVKLEQDTVWLTQKQMAELFQKEALTINEHIQNVYEEKELDRSTTIRKSLIVQFEGQRRTERIFQ